MGRVRGKVSPMKFINQFILAVATVFIASNVLAAPEFLPPEKAFQAEVAWLENTNNIELEIFLAKGYYIYQESLRL